MMLKHFNNYDRGENCRWVFVPTSQTMSKQASLTHTIDVKSVIRLFDTNEEERLRRGEGGEIMCSVIQILPLQP